MKIIMARDLLGANARRGQENRSVLDRHRVMALNLISSPGAGKTTLLEKTIACLKEKLAIGVIEGDLYTARDAERVSGQGAAAVQINTGGTCHLDAGMVARALEELPLASLDLLFIENVGNLVCPAAFYLGEHYKVAILSMAEGSDKPSKYPEVFREAQAAVISKSDLQPYTDFDPEGCIRELRAVNPELRTFVLSAKTGQGM
ncbi:MAG: hydrogenase nickel incorporation protein HypB, partial [Peptococcaceae bacterium]|nr:hydrogenase nickel incorporation protein HypB [Peptococcaceae bacterium]